LGWVESFWHVYVSREIRTAGIVKKVLIPGEA